MALLLGNPSLAREAVETITSDSKQHAEALVVRGQAELNLGDLEGALVTFAEAERKYPGRPEVRLVRIATLLSERRRDEAHSAIDEALAALDAPSATLAETLADREKHAEMRHRLEVTLAQIQEGQGEPNAAATTLREMVEKDAGDLRAWQALIRLLARQKRSDEAAALLDAALRADNPPIELHRLAAQVHASLADPVAAESEFLEYVSLSESAAAYVPLVNYYAARGDSAATTRVLDEAIGRYPDEPRLRLRRTEALLEEARSYALARGVGALPFYNGKSATGWVAQMVIKEHNQPVH
ncbi:MAG: tetratricopeptide repeat protein [Deltaproteobacteria bacterium]|nr:tetratricopeptide repeat protein [Deltaproteobacteria bacterium]